MLIGALALAACGGDDDDTSASENAPPAATDASAADSPFDATDRGSIETGGDSVEGDADTGGGFDIGVIGRDVIIEMQVTLSSDNIQRTVASIMAQASSLGGGVASSNVNYGNHSEPGGADGYAVLVVKVPPQSLDRLLAGLDDAGTVQSINQSAQDVTEQLIDLEVRIRNARQSVDNVREFMDRTENLKELVTLEGELTRRQTDLERLEAQQRNLSDRVALSTVTIEVVPTASIPEPIDDDADTIGDAFRKGWDAFTGFIFGIGFILAVLLPFLALAAVLGLLGWALVRHTGRRPIAEHATPTMPRPAPTEPADTDPSSDADRDADPEITRDDAEPASRPG
jgi:hypothetical protein